MVAKKTPDNSELAEVKATAMATAAENQALKDELAALKAKQETVVADAVNAKALELKKDASVFQQGAKARVVVYQNCVIVECEGMSELEFTMLAQQVGAYRKVYDAEARTGSATVYTNGGSKKGNRQNISRIQSILASL